MPAAPMNASLPTRWDAPSSRTAQPLLDQALAGAVKAARDDGLPPWVWTLGLSQPEMRLLVESVLPGLGELASLTEPQYAALLRALPEDVRALAGTVVTAAGTTITEQHARCLALAVAAACSGACHLRQELEPPDRPTLSQLMQQYFAELADTSRAARAC